MRKDSDIQQDVMDELDFDPSVTSEHIGVWVKNGVVTLTGNVPTYGEKFAAERAAFRVEGVKAVAENIDVILEGLSERTDFDIAKAAADALIWRSNIPSSVKVKVEDGRLTLKGEVEWGFQREAAEDAVRYLNGVKSVNNQISIKKRIHPHDIKERIEKALVRAAREEARNINVETDKGRVILKGTVHSRVELEDAKWAAWAAPGVTNVDNRLTISA